MDSINRLMISSMESMAQMSVGQAIFRMVDKVMWIIEKSVQWSLPTAEPVTEENGKSFGKPELVRPLPWIVFLPTILVLRLFRASLNAVAAILGYPTIEPFDMIRAVQRGRRRLRAIKTSGLKSIRQRNTPAGKSKVGSEGKMSDEGGTHSPKTDVKRKYSELSDDSSEDEYDNETLLSKIERLANDSGSDKSYNPSESTTSDLSDSVSSEADVSISMSEIQELNENGEMDKVIAPEKEKVQPDSEMNKSCNEAETIKNPEVMERPQNLAVSGWGNGSEETYVSGNGVSGDTDTTYYSPISWKSISPDFSPDNKNSQTDVKRNPEVLSNGEVNKKQNEDHVRNEACVESNETVVNGLIKEKPRSTSSHSGGSQKHHKHKRGNHGHRKKK